MKEFGLRCIESEICNERECAKDAEQIGIQPVFILRHQPQINWERND